MASSRATTVAQYLAELPADRRAVIAAVRDQVNAKLPRGYVETMNWGMICWEVPLSRYPDTYNGHPLSYMALAAQKGNYALYTMAAYTDPALMAWLQDAFRKAGRKLDMGKVCLRFASLDHLPAGVVGRLAAASTVEQFIAQHERGRHGATKPAKKPAPRKTARVATAPAKSATAPKRTPAAKAKAKAATKKKAARR